MRLSWQDAGHPISISHGARRILRKQGLHCDDGRMPRPRGIHHTRDQEAAVMGVSAPVEIDPELLDLLRSLIEKEGVEFVEDALSNHMKANGYPIRDQEPTDLQAQMAQQQVERQNNRDGLTTTGGGNNLEPSSRAGESGGYLPNQAGTVSSTSVNTTVAKSMNPGQLFGVTSDRLKQHWMQQDRQTSSLIRDIERRWRGRAA